MQKLIKFWANSWLAAGFLLMSFCLDLSYAQHIPHLIRYKGNIKELLKESEVKKEDAKEEKEKDGKTYSLTFRIYNLEVGGEPLWIEAHPEVLVEKQEFEVLLGSITSLDLKFNQDYWLSIEIDSQGEIIPRERMTSVGYAYMADDSYKLGGRYADDFAIFGHSHIGEDVVSPVAESINADTVDGLHADQIGGIKDHGLLEGLADDDHLQYLNILRGDERYAGVGWDGLTKLKTAQDHIADRSNPHAVTLEQLGHLDNNSEEEAPTLTERGEPTGTEIQGWADDILAWGHSNLVASLNADKLDGKDSTEFSLLGHFHTLMDLSDVTSELRAAFLAAGTAGASGTNRLATMTDILAIPPPLGLWTDEGTYIYPNNPGDNRAFRITDDGNVSIGTAETQSKVTIKGQANNGLTIIGTGGSPLVQLRPSGAEHGELILYNNVEVPTVWIQSSTGYTYFNGGNVGIGTANPKAVLDVNGDLSVNGPIYQRGSLLHADYVFEPDYKLESIDEHAKFMWQEKHLKAVPKAAKTEDGQEIMEMGSRQRGVLEELEKAHIYIAQLNERLKQLEAKLAGQPADAR